MPSLTKVRWNYFKHQTKELQDLQKSSLFHKCTLPPDLTIVIFSKPNIFTFTSTTKLFSEDFWLEIIQCSFLKSAKCSYDIPLSWGAMKCEQVPKPLDLVRYRLALSEWPWKFYDDMAELFQKQRPLESEEWALQRLLVSYGPEQQVWKQSSFSCSV